MLNQYIFPEIQSILPCVLLFHYIQGLINKLIAENIHQKKRGSGEKV